HGVEHALAEGQPSRGVADERGEHVAFAQGESDGDAQGLLATTQEDAADNFAATIEAGQFVIKHSGKEHPTEGSNVVVARHGRGERRIATDNRFQHAPYIKPLRRVGATVSLEVAQAAQPWREGPGRWVKPWLIVPGKKEVACA